MWEDRKVARASLMLCLYSIALNLAFLPTGEEVGVDFIFVKPLNQANIIVPNAEVLPIGKGDEVRARLLLFPQDLAALCSVA